MSIEALYPSFSPNENASYFQGLTEEQWLELQTERATYQAMTPEEKLIAWGNFQVRCNGEFNHLYWEDLIAINIIRHFADNSTFNDWTLERERITQCTDIYSFAQHFAIAEEELIAFIVEDNLTHIYDVETMRRRFEYFNSIASE